MSLKLCCGDKKRKIDGLLKYFHTDHEGMIEMELCHWFNGLKKLGIILLEQSVVSDIDSSWHVRNTPIDLACWPLHGSSTLAGKEIWLNMEDFSYINRSVFTKAHDHLRSIISRWRWANRGCIMGSFQAAMEEICCQAVFSPSPQSEWWYLQIIGLNLSLNHNCSIDFALKRTFTRDWTH